MSSDRVQSTYDPRYDGIYQRGGATQASPQASPQTSPRTAPRMASPASPAPALPIVPEASAEPSAIREVVPDVPVRQDRRTPANPYDRWMWIVAGALAALGLFFLLAPVVFEKQYMESMTSGQLGPSYVTPWYNYTSMAAPVLLLLGVATAVAQLFVLSLRHTLRTR